MWPHEDWERDSLRKLLPSCLARSHLAVSPARKLWRKQQCPSSGYSSRLQGAGPVSSRFGWPHGQHTSPRCTGAPPHPHPNHRPWAPGIIQPSAFWWFCPSLMGFHSAQIQSISQRFLRTALQISRVFSLTLSPNLSSLIFCTVNSSQFPLILISAPQSHWRPLSTLSILLPAPWPGSGCRQQAGTAVELTLCVFHSLMLPANPLSGNSVIYFV